MDNALKYQEKVLKLLAGKIDDFYLGGGTALSRIYFRHRLSYDLDFFTKAFSIKRISEIIKQDLKPLELPISLAGEQNKEKFVKIAVYNIHIKKDEVLKLDFIEDLFELLKPLKTVDGIKILSLEDIYLRKVFSIAGTVETTSIVGRKIFKGGRQEAKDFYDLYILSDVFMRLSKFAGKYCDAAQKEALITWFRTYNRMDIKTGLLDLATDNKINYPNIERHFKKEIDKLIAKEIGL
jgi:predicted nucleotidyltransferase component of viral defense system